MAAPAVYRVPRRFVTFPDDPPPYGFLAVSFFAHLACFGAALGLSAFLGSRIDQSKVYIVNLVPATPSLGSPVTQAPPPAPAPAARAPEAPRPPAPAPPKAEEKAPPKAPPRPPERVVEPPPPRVPDVAAARPKTLEPSELALPKRVEKEPPALPPPPAPKAVERTLPPPPPVAPPAAPITPAAPTRLPEPPRIAAPPTAPATPAAPPAPAAAVARPGVEPIRLGRPNATTTSTGSIAVDASDFPFTYYLRLIQSKIGERWSPPRAAATGGERVIVLFEIQRDGQVREPTVERSSGNALYDQSALRAITEASPFPPLPPEFKASSLRVHFGFEFTPGQG
jgi:TonB family protein